MAFYNELQLILGSNSPRRRQIMEMAGYSFSIEVSDIEELVDPEWDVEEAPVYLARQKADHIFSRIARKDVILLTADTVVLLEGSIIGKPADLEEARQTLRLLSGKSHMVVSGVCLRRAGDEKHFSDTTMVHFGPLSDKEIDHYVQNFEVLDKAGAYAIQEGVGLYGIDGIEGSYYNVMGLPVHRVYRALAEWGHYPER